MEDNFDWPAKEKYFDLSELHKEHKELEVLLKDLTEFSSGAKTFDANTISSLLNQADLLLHVHLQREEELFSVDNLKKVFPPELYSEIERTGNAYHKSLDGAVLLPCLLLNMSPEERSAFTARFPFILKRIIFPYVLVPKHKGWWRFAAYPDA